ncbi:biliverdin-producing heme oxygenase [Falsiroseomonas sp.]|uniref:biliverdin-producing heme oxygenase n=1 Tax=Falsiroseomonas sp. TaxID=2870721 RepID=UPI0035631B1F
MSAEAPGSARGELRDSARDELRDATEAAHLRLHAIPAFQALAEGRITLAGYAALLRRKLGFHAALEARLEEAPSLTAFGIETAARRRTPLLLADLAFLAAPEEAPSAPLLAPLPPFGSAAEALGGLYVAEGSTLGGRHLARALDAILPPGPEGRRFLLGHGARHGEMWRACCAAIERCGTAPEGRAGMIRGATATFAAFEEWFTFPASPAVAGARGAAATPEAGRGGGSLSTARYAAASSAVPP